MNYMISMGLTETGEELAEKLRLDYSRLLNFPVSMNALIRYLTRMVKDFS